MSDLSDPKSDLSIKINRATDIYVLKKDDLIKYCESKNLKSTGRSSDLRSRLGRYLKGILKSDDIKESVGKEQYAEIIKKSLAQKIDLEKLEKEAGIPETSPESRILTDVETQNKILNNQIESLKLFDQLNNSASSVTEKLDNILNSDELKDARDTEKHRTDNLINLYNTTIDPSTDLPNNLNKTFKKMDNFKNMLVKPDKFSGEGDVKHFLKQYEKAATINNWDDNEKVKFLSIFLDNTASFFFENLEDKNTILTWDMVKAEFLNEYQPIGYDTILKTKLENRRQGETESVASYITEIENICRQLNKKMKEEKICTYILKGLKESVLQAISLHENNNLKELKTNLKKYELMQFRINSRSPNINEYNEILNKHIMQINKNVNNRDDEINDLKKQLNELKLQINNTGKINKSVNFSNARDRSYEREANYLGQKHDYRDKNPYLGRQNYRSRESSMNRQNNRERSLSRDRQYERRPREYSTDRDYNRENSYISNNYGYRDNSRNRDRSYERETNNVGQNRDYRDKSPSIR